MQEKEIIIDVKLQRLSLRGAQGEELFSAPCSTGAAGTGCEEGSGKTPTGRFRICSKHGSHAPLNTVFRSRLPVGIYDPQNSADADAILARILCLEGLEPHNANTRARYIYIHGTADTARIGSPVSHGCIRLAPEAAARLYELAPLLTPVTVTP